MNQLFREQASKLMLNNNINAVNMKRGDDDTVCTNVDQTEKGYLNLIKIGGIMLCGVGG